MISYWTAHNITLSIYSLAAVKQLNGNPKGNVLHVTLISNT